MCENQNPYFRVVFTANYTAGRRQGICELEIPFARALQPEQQGELKRVFLEKLLTFGNLADASIGVNVAPLCRTCGLPVAAAVDLAANPFSGLAPEQVNEQLRGTASQLSSFLKISAEFLGASNSLEDGVSETMVVFLPSLQEQTSQVAPWWRQYLN